MRPKE